MRFINFTRRQVFLCFITIRLEKKPVLTIGGILIHIMKSCNLEVLLCGGTETSNLSVLMSCVMKEDVVDGLGIFTWGDRTCFTESIKITSFLLLKSLTPYNSAVVSNEAFKGLNTVLISRVSELKNMSDAERLNMKGTVLNAVLATPVSGYTEELTAFYQMTRSCYTENLYGCAGWYFYNRYGSLTREPLASWRIRILRIMVTGPREIQDVGMYIKAMFTHTVREEFEALWRTFSVVMTKYEIMKTVLRDIGVSI